MFLFSHHLLLLFELFTSLMLQMCLTEISHYRKKKKKQQRNKTVAARQLVQDNLRSAVSFQNKSKIWYTDISV